MPTARFQSAVGALVTDGEFRDRVRRGHVEGGLTVAERTELARLAHDPGVDVTAQLIASFRLGKLLSLLPLTRVVLGNDVLADEVGVFWQAYPPTSFYPPVEALQFCDFLERRIAEGALADPRLGVVIAAERARVERSMEESEPSPFNA